VLLTVGVVVAIVVSAVVLIGRQSRHHVIHGLYTIGPNIRLYWGGTKNCIFSGNSYLNLGQIRVGTPVTVNDTSGKIIAVGAVRIGLTTNQGRTCTFSYDVTVPERSGYVIQVSNWDPFVVSRSELDANHWRSGTMPGQ
jgi:hypothetical protein